MELLSIGQLAQRAEVGVETVRHYERRGLLQEPQRRQSGYRQYSRGRPSSVRVLEGGGHICVACDWSRTCPNHCLFRSLVEANGSIAGSFSLAGVENLRRKLQNVVANSSVCNE